MPTRWHVTMGSQEYGQSDARCLNALDIFLRYNRRHFLNINFPCASSLGGDGKVRDSILSTLGPVWTRLTLVRMAGYIWFRLAGSGPVSYRILGGIPMHRIFGDHH